MKRRAVANTTESTRYHQKSREVLMSRKFLNRSCRAPRIAKEQSAAVVVNLADCPLHSAPNRRRAIVFGGLERGQGRAAFNLP